MTLSDLSSMIPYLYSGILIKMSRKNNDHTKKPWEKTFEEIKDDKGNYSRRASRQSNKRNTMLTTILLGVFVVIIVSTIVFYFVSQRASRQTVSTDDSIEVVSSSEKNHLRVRKRL